MFTHLYRRGPRLRSNGTKATTDNKPNISEPSHSSTTEPKKRNAKAASVKSSTIQRRALGLQDRTKMYTFDYDEAPEDELLGLADMKREKIVRNIAHFEHRRPDPPIANNYNSMNHHHNNHFAHDDDEARCPPPMEIVTNASTNHPDFEAWKRDMTRNLMSGTVQSSTLNQRRIEKKLLHRQLRSVKSDTSLSSESSDDALSIEACFSSSFLQTGKDFKTRKSPRESRSMDEIRSVNNRKTRREPCPLRDNDMTYPQAKKENKNSTEVAEIMVELSNLKTWAAGDVQNTLRTATPPASPCKSPKSPRSPKSPQQQDTGVASPSIQVAEIQNIAVPQLVPSGALVDPQTNGKTTLDHVIGNDKGIPSMLTITKKETPTTTITDKGTTVAWVKPKKKHKRVRFARGYVTDTFYRPWTREEDIDDLFFQDDELLLWERDELTTPIDRFEVVLDDQTSFTGTLSIGTPAITFHNSYSCDEESCEE